MAYPVVAGVGLPRLNGHTAGQRAGPIWSPSTRRLVAGGSRAGGTRVTRERSAVSAVIVVVTGAWPEAVEDELRRRYAGVRLNAEDTPLGADGLRAALMEADIVLPTVSDKLPAELFEGELRTRFLGNFGVGYNHIDIEAAAKAGIVVTNTPRVLTDTTADTAMTLLLMVARRAGEGEREVRAGRWTGWRPTHMMGADVTGKTLGILGMGRIGMAVARRGHFGFGMPVVFYDPVDFEPDHGIPGARRVSTIGEVLDVADFVSLHMPGGGGN